MKRVLMGALVAVCVCFSGSVVAEDAKAPAKAPAKAAAKAPAAPAYRIWPAADLKWVDAEAAKGVRVLAVARAEGECASSSYRARSRSRSRASP